MLAQQSDVSRLETVNFKNIGDSFLYLSISPQASKCISLIVAKDNFRVLIVIKMQARKRILNK